MSGSLSPPPDGSSSADKRLRTSSLTPEPLEELPERGELVAAAIREDDPLDEDEGGGDVTMRAELPIGFQDDLEEENVGDLIADRVSTGDIEDIIEGELLDGRVNGDIPGEAEMVENGEGVGGQDLEDPELAIELEPREETTAEDGDEADTPGSLSPPAAWDPASLTTQ